MRYIGNKLTSVVVACIMAITTVTFSPNMSGTASASGCVTTGGGSSSSTGFYQYQARLGAVALDQAATFLADMSDIKGAYYDPDLDRIVFVGKNEVNAPKFDKDDLAVAIRAVVFRNTIPRMGMWPGSNPDQYNVTYEGGIENTKFGKSLFDADYRLKEYIHGGYANGQVLSSGVPTYKSYSQRYVEKGINFNAPFYGGSFTISPEYVNLKRDYTTNSFVFADSGMKVTYEAWGPNDPNSTAAGVEFAQEQTQHYDQYSQESPAYAEAKRLAKMVSVVKWIKDSGISTDFSWARDYTPQFVQTPQTVQKYNSVHGGVTFYGGLQYDTANTYQSDDGAASGTKAASQAQSSSKEDLHWTFTKDGQQYDSVAVSADAFRSLGGYGTSSTDLTSQVAQNSKLEFTRSYSSFSDSQKGIGRGWDMTPARLTDDSPGAMTTCDGGVTWTTTPISLSFQTADGTYEAFTYVCGQGYLPNEIQYYSKLTYNESTGEYTVKQKDQKSYVFDSNLRLKEIRDKNSFPVRYEYDSQNRINKIKAVANNSSGAIRDINVAYGTNGLVSSVTDWANRTVSYSYDTAGYLTGVTDPRGNTAQYTYDANNKLSMIADRIGGVYVSNTYTPEAKLHVQSDIAGSNDTTFSYNNDTRTITATDYYNRVTKTSYDDRARITKQIDASQNTIEYVWALDQNIPFKTIDKRGNITQNSFDIFEGNLLGTTFPDGKKINYEYDSERRLTKISDERYGTTPKETTFTYDTLNNITQKNEAGRITQYVYQGTGDPVSMTNPQGSTTQWTYNGFGKKLTEKNGLNQTTSFEYDTAGRLVKQTDPTGKIKTTGYDANNNVTSITDAAGTTTNEYDAEDRLAKVIAPDGAQTQYSYSGKDELFITKDTQNKETWYDYDAYSNLIAKKDNLDHITFSTYDAMNHKTQATNALGKATKWEYDASGNMTARIDAQNQRTTYEYDVLNRLKKITYPDTSTAVNTYDDRGNLTKIVDPSGTTTYTYDTFDRLTAATDPNGSAIAYTYDANDNITSVKYPDNKEVKYLYDQANQLRSVIDWNNEVTSYQYDKNGQVRLRRLPNDISTRYTYDGAGRLSSMHHANGATSLAKFSYIRDAAGRVTTKRESLPASWLQHSLFDDALGTNWSNISTNSTVNTANTSAVYEGTKSLKWQATSMGGNLKLQTTVPVNSQTYRSLVFAAKAASSNQAFKVQLFNSTMQPAGPEVMVANYGGAPEPTGFDLYAIPLSDLVTGSDKNIAAFAITETGSGSPQPAILDSLKFSTVPASAPFEKVYTDARAPLWQDISTGSTNNFANTTNVLSGLKSLAWTPATNGSLRFQHSSGRQTAGYESLGFAIKGSATNQPLVAQLFDATGNPLGSGVNVADYGGNPTPNGYRMYEIPLSDLNGVNKVISGFQIKNSSGSAQPALYVDTVRLIPAEPTAIPFETTTYAYDTLGRLTNATYPGGGVFTYTYDAAGNRLTASEVGVSKTYTYNADNQLTAVNSQTYTNDDNGRMTGNGVRTFTYNYDDYMKSMTNVSNSQTTTYTYDSQGNRIAKNVNGTITKYVNDVASDLTQVLAEKNAAGAITDYYIYGQDLVSQGGPNKTDRQYYLDDGLGDVRFVTNYNGSTFSSLKYTPYGTMIGAAGGADFQFRGEPYEPEAGLIYLRARYYNPYTGNFTTKDPVPGTLTNAQSQNGYTYTYGDPINQSDPTGKWIETAWDIANIGYDIYNCDWESLGFDTLAAFVPLLPAGVTKLDDAAKFANNAGKATKQTSKVWNGMKTYRGDIKTNGQSGSSRQYYQWDYTHNDIEVYDKTGKHLGSMDATSGQMIKPAVKGRSININ